MEITKAEQHAYENFKQEVENTINVMQACLESKQIQYRKKQIYGCPEEEWIDVSFEDLCMEMEGFDTVNNEYRVKPDDDCDKYSIYPNETGEKDVDFLKLQSGRIYLVKSMDAESNLRRGYICIDKICSDYTLSLHFGVFLEQRGTKVVIADPDAHVYRSVASDECCNQIFEFVGMIGASEYLYYIPSKEQVRAAEAFVNNLGYKFEDNKIQKI